MTCLILFTGCATRNTRPVPPPEKPGANQPLPPKNVGNREASNQPVEKPPVRRPPPSQPEKQLGAAPDKPSPMALAALALSDKGQAYLRDGKPDEAIRVLERAINLHPQKRENYYYLAEAWLLKGNTSQAKEFNHLAAIHAGTDPEWMRRVQSQKDRIIKSK